MPEPKKQCTLMTDSYIQYLHTRQAGLLVNNHYYRVLFLTCPLKRRIRHILLLIVGAYYRRTISFKLFYLGFSWKSDRLCCLHDCIPDLEWGEGHTSHFSLYVLPLLFYWQVLRRHRKKNPHTTTPLSGRGGDATPPSTPPCTTCPPTPLPRTNPSQASSSSHGQPFFSVMDLFRIRIRIRT